MHKCRDCCTPQPPVIVCYTPDGGGDGRAFMEFCTAATTDPGTPPTTTCTPAENVPWVLYGDDAKGPLLTNPENGEQYGCYAEKVVDGVVLIAEYQCDPSSFDYFVPTVPGLTGDYDPNALTLSSSGFADVEFDSSVPVVVSRVKVIDLKGTLDQSVIFGQDLEALDAATNTPILPAPNPSGVAYDAGDEAFLPPAGQDNASSALVWNVPWGGTELAGATTEKIELRFDTQGDLSALPDERTFNQVDLFGPVEPCCNGETTPECTGGGGGGTTTSAGVRWLDVTTGTPLTPTEQATIVGCPEDCSC